VVLGSGSTTGWRFLDALKRPVLSSTQRPFVLVSASRFDRQPIPAQRGYMTGDAIPSLIMQIIDELRAQGILMTEHPAQ
jgi:hypothetical protein